MSDSSEVSIPVSDPEKSYYHRVTTFFKRRRDRHRATIGQILADWITRWVGSWFFIIGQSAIFVFWVVYNGMNAPHTWDPYPFILLNLMLSFQAAYTGPIILVAQNRQDYLDRLKAADLDEKVDHLRIQLMHDIAGLLLEQQVILTQLVKANHAQD
jgi:uncharacterized membrane protein